MIVNNFFSNSLWEIAFLVWDHFFNPEGVCAMTVKWHDCVRKKLWKKKLFYYSCLICICLHFQKYLITWKIWVCQYHFLCRIRTIQLELEITALLVSGRDSAGLRSCALGIAVSLALMEPKFAAERQLQNSRLWNLIVVLNAWSAVSWSEVLLPCCHPMWTL